MTLLAAMLGWMAGAALNVLADDLPGRTAGAPDRFARPFAWPTCDYCGRLARPWLWSGLLAFLLRGSRCPGCTAPARQAGGRLRPPLVELGLAAAFASLWARWPERFALAALPLCTLLLITVIDFEHRLILYVVSLPGAALMLAVGMLTPGRDPGRTLLGGAAGLGAMAGLYLLGMAFSRALARLRGMAPDEVAFGGGDVMVGLVVGLLTGWPGVALALLLAVLAAGLAGGTILLWQVLRGRYRPFTAMAYGPYLALGGLVVYLWGGDLARLLW